MNIAERILSYYETSDFADNYADMLGEDTHACIERIQRIFSDNYGEKLTFEQAEKVLKWFIENNQYRTFSGYYVGYYSFASISFGEQEEQLTGLHNHKTGKPYNIAYLKQVFEDAGYVVSGDCAYMDLNSQGVHFDLRDFEPMFDINGGFDSVLLWEFLS